MSNLLELLSHALASNQLQVNANQQKQLVAYLQLLQSWNHVFNLTSITDVTDMVNLHIIDSLLIYPYLQNKYHLDVGSGAGLPGIPLAIINPEHQWTVLDKNGKKCRFMTQAVAELKLPNVSVIHNRCETFHPAQSFDNIVSRAFGSLRFFIETTHHLLASQGTLIAMKGKFPQQELDDIPDGFMIENVIRLQLKDIEVERHLVCIRRIEGNDG